MILKILKIRIILILILIYNIFCTAKVNINNNNSSTSGTIGGIVTGLSAGSTVVLQNNGSDNLAVTGSGTGSDAFSFSRQIAVGSPYSVSVLSAPAGKTCVAGANTGIVISSNISTVLVTCSSSTIYTLGGSITGLAGSGLMLQNSVNAGTFFDFISPAAASASYTFPHSLVNLDSYNISVISQPTNPSQNCTVTGALGAISGANGTANINCVTNNYAISGNISGMVAGESITLNNGFGPVLLTAAVTGTQVFTFPGIADLSVYTVTVTTPPAGKTCTVTNGGGTLAGAPVNNVFITCTSAGTFTVGGNATTGITGLAKNATIVLNLTSSIGVSESLPVTNTTGAPSVNLPYTFLNAFSTGASVTVTIVNPSNPSQTCTPGGAMGPIAVAGANVVLPLITCTTNSFAISGNVTGLTPLSDVLTVTMTSTTNGVANPVQNFPIIASAATMPFNFTAIADGSTYSVSISSFSPAGKSCGAPLTGILSGAAITTLALNCAVGPSVSVTVAGLTVGGGTGLRVQLNGNLLSNLSITANGTYAFTQPALIAGDAYSVSIIQQPNRLSANTIDQFCILSPNSSGTLAPGGVIINVACSTTAYPVTGTVAGMAAGEQSVPYNMTLSLGQIVTGAGAGSDPYTLSSMNDGTAYTLGIQQSPPNKKCVYSNGLQTISGTVSGAGIVQNITCAPKSPGGFVVAGGNGQSTVSWTPVAGFTYNLYWSNTPGITIGGVGVTKIPGVISPYLHTLLTNGVSYYYAMTATAMGLEGALSPEVSTMPLAPPAASEGLVGTPLVVALPHNGGIVGSVSSYYQVNGLTPGASYIVNLTNLSGNASLSVYTDLFITLNCASSNPSALSEGCAVTVPVSGSIYVLVSGTGTITYTLSGTAWPPVPAAVLTVNAIYNPAGFTSVNVQSGPAWVSFPVTAATQYTVYWDDAFNGSGNFSADVAVSGYDSAGNLLPITSSFLGLGGFFGSKTTASLDSGYSTPTVFTAAATGTVYLRATPNWIPGVLGMQVTSP